MAMKLILPMIFGAAMCGAALAQGAATSIELSVQHPTGIAKNGPGYYKCDEPAPAATFVVCQKLTDTAAQLFIRGRLLAHCMTSQEEAAYATCSETAPGSVCEGPHYLLAHCDNPPESKP